VRRAYEAEAEIETRKAEEETETINRSRITGTTRQTAPTAIRR